MSEEEWLEAVCKRYPDIARVVRLAPSLADKNGYITGAQIMELYGLPTEPETQGIDKPSEQTP